jgi:exosortase K
MNRKTAWSAQLLVVMLCALALKFHYSTATPDQLRWILAPTTLLVELISRTPFTFESYAGYMSGDHSFLIAASCAGVNFLITAFLMLSLRRLWIDRFQAISWRFIPLALLFVYLATIVANTARICVALRLRQMAPVIGWLDPNQIHRLEGIFIYFAFLMFLFLVSEKIRTKSHLPLFRLSIFPLLIYYATTLGIPLANGAYRQGSDFLQHALFVLIIPLLLIVPVATWRAYRVLRLKQL